MWFLAGYDVEVLDKKLADWNTEFALLSSEQRDHQYKTLVLTTKEKFVPPFHLVYSTEVNGEWVIEKYITRVTATKKEMAKPYPGTTEQSESEDQQEETVSPHDIAMVEKDLETSTTDESKKVSRLFPVWLQYENI